MRRHASRATVRPAVALLAALLGATSVASSQTRGAARPPCDPDNGGLTLPDGFCAVVVADGIGAARHLAVAPNGDVFVALNNSRASGPGGVVALRDTDGDGKADRQERFGDNGGSGIALRGGWLYFAPNDAVLRFPIPAGAMRPAGPPDTVVLGLPDTRSHRAKSIAIGADGALYVDIGSPSNACQSEDRQEGSPGVDPCPELATRAGIWRFATDRLRQRQRDGRRFATGIRNGVALTAHPGSGVVYVAQHGRDQLAGNWPGLFDNRKSAELPSEELFRVDDGDDFGWPYCYHDWQQGRKVLAPEYGGNGRDVGRCADVEQPLVAFPGHWAPDGLLFYTGRGENAFPDAYRDGAFIAFHGSWNRAPLAQAGYKIVFVPFTGERPSGEPATFADGFAGAIKQPGDADHRPTGLAEGPDGSLYIADDAGGRIWRVVYTGRSR